jgi:hypothetical protein
VADTAAPNAGPITPVEAEHVLRVLESGRNNPDTWTREERAAVSALFAVKDGRRG